MAFRRQQKARQKRRAFVFYANELVLVAGARNCLDLLLVAPSLNHPALVG